MTRVATDADIAAYNDRRTSLAARGMAVPPDLYGQDRDPDPTRDPVGFLEQAGADHRAAQLAELIELNRPEVPEPDLLATSDKWLREAEQRQRSH